MLALIIITMGMKNLLAERFTDAWRLLSETTSFLSRTPVFALYEEELRSWRHDLQGAPKGGDEYKRVRQEIIELRTSLRQQGFDLSLARQNLVLEGFRNDTSLAEGFRRVVVFLGDDGAYWLAGDENHVTLAELLERQIGTRKQHISIRSKHYLWYCRKGDSLVLAGSDTETKEDYEHLKAMAEVNSLVILAKLKNLK